MTERELVKLLKANGWVITEGGSHHIARHPKTKCKVAIPRHKGDIPAGTLNSILKDAGLK